MSDQDSGKNTTTSSSPPSTTGARRASPLAWAALILTIVTLSTLLWFWQQSRNSNAGIKGRLNAVESTVLKVQDLTQATRNTAIAAENVADALEKRLDAMSHHLDARTDALQMQISDLNDSVNSVSNLLRQRKSAAFIVADAKNLVAQAQHHLQFGGDTGAVIAALETASQHLQETGDPSLFEARKTINDISSALKKRASIDITNLALTLSTLEQGIDPLPISGADHQNSNTSAPEKVEGFSGLIQKIWSDIKGLISIHHQSDPKDIALLPPERRFFLQQNLHLQISAARLALLQRNDKIFHDAINATHEWVNTYYNPKAAETKAFLVALSQLKAIDLKLPESDFKRTLDLLSAWQQQNNALATSGKGTR
ncbi:MAG: uroporphyrinogen-III C-methyltransferase [Gammaproteobacteria bacterium]|nr:uroporphyrinogen-III C-methyltransferase [Gammaproteobacteria bacterium]